MRKVTRESFSGLRKMQTDCVEVLICTKCNVIQHGKEYGKHFLYLSSCTKI